MTTLLLLAINMLEDHRFTNIRSYATTNTKERDARHILTVQLLLNQTL